MRLRAPAERAELLAVALFDLGALGLEEHEAPHRPNRERARGTSGPTSRSPVGAAVELAAYFPHSGVDEGGLAEVLGTLGARLLERRVVEPADWLARYRALSRPSPLGRSFLADPRETDEVGEPAAVAGRTTLRLPARTAFGTGSHESTRLAVELLEDDPPVGSRVLDLGTGSGVLAFVALMLGARTVVALDIDPAAGLVAGQIAALNGQRPLLAVGELVCLRAAALFDRLLVNMIPAHWLPEKERLRELLAPGGRLLLSGLLAEQRREVVAETATLGLTPVAERRAGEWGALWLAVNPRR